MTTMSLGELISALKRKPTEAEVVFDFVYFHPNGRIHSYRGNYCQLAIGYSNEYPNPVTVGSLLKTLEESVGKVFQGYKGGNYLMSERAPVWVADTNESGSTAIVDINTDEIDQVVFITKKVGV